MRKILTVILIVIIFVIVVLLSLNYYFTKSGYLLPNDMKVQTNYKIVYVSAVKNNIDVEYYIIVDKEKNAVETRVIESGYTDEELNNTYLTNLTIKEI